MALLVAFAVVPCLFVASCLIHENGYKMPPRNHLVLNRIYLISTSYFSSSYSIPSTQGTHNLTT